MAPPTLISGISFRTRICYAMPTLNSFTWQVKLVELRKSVPNTVTFLHGRLRLSHKPSPCNLVVGKLIKSVRQSESFTVRNIIYKSGCIQPRFQGPSSFHPSLAPGGWEDERPWELGWGYLMMMMSCMSYSCKGEFTFPK